MVVILLRMVRQAGQFDVLIAKWMNVKVGLKLPDEVAKKLFLQVAQL